MVFHWGGTLSGTIFVHLIVVGIKYLPFWSHQTVDKGPIIRPGPYVSVDCTLGDRDWPGLYPYFWECTKASPIPGATGSLVAPFWKQVLSERRSVHGRIPLLFGSVIQNAAEFEAPVKEKATGSRSTRRGCRGDKCRRRTTFPAWWMFSSRAAASIVESFYCWAGVNKGFVSKNSKRLWFWMYSMYTAPVNLMNGFTV